MNRIESSTVIREMRAGDIESAMELKNAERWNQTESDWRHLLKQNPQLCLVAEVEGEVVGTVTAAKFGSELAWIGMMLVAEQMRGRGLSKSLLGEILRRLEGCAAIKLDATPKGQPIYERLGFIKERTIHRLEATAPVLTGMMHRGVAPERIQPGDLSNLVALDLEIYGVDRRALIQFCLESAPDRCWLVRQSNSIRGFLLGRPGSRNHYLGPMEAESLDMAKSLLAVASQLGGPSGFVIDVPADQVDLMEWLVSGGFSLKRTLYRMHYRKNPGIGDETRQYAIAGPEFG